MDWSDLGKKIASIGLPLLGAVLPVPGGAAIGSALASAIGSKTSNPQEILDILTSNAEAMEKAKEFEATHQETMLKMQLDFMASERADETTVITAEAKGESWLQRNWRPLMMVWFGVLLGMYWFGIMPPNLTQATLDHLFSLMQLGIGGYVGGRSLEKITPAIANAIASNKS